MKTSLSGFNLVAAAVLISGMVPVTWAVAQTAYPAQELPVSGKAPLPSQSTTR